MKQCHKANYVKLCDIVQWGIHTGPVVDIRQDGDQFYIQIEHVADVISEGGVKRKVKTWVKEQDLQPATASSAKHSVSLGGELPAEKSETESRGSVSSEDVSSQLKSSNG